MHFELLTVFKYTFHKMLISMYYKRYKKKQKLFFIIPEFCVVAVDCNNLRDEVMVFGKDNMI